MTEYEWLICSDPDEMLQQLRGEASDRKLRLFACGCCRRILHLMTDKWSQTVVEVAERLADGNVTAAELQAVRDPHWDISHDRFHFQSTLVRDAYSAAELSARLARTVVYEHSPRRQQDGALGTERASQAIMLGCIFGNPFVPISFDPQWITSDVRALAEAIYDDRAFDRLLILADALMDAGCADEQILGHCRGPGPHVRGCWVVDLVLGKE